MYKKILVPLDGSERAEAIIPHVEELAKRYDADIVFVQVVEPNYGLVGVGGDMSTYQILQTEIKRRQQEAEHYLAEWCMDFAKKEIACEAHVTFGTVITELLRIAEEQSVDIIAMSSHGRTGLPRVFYGSVAAGLLHQATFPLLLIRAVTD